METRNIRLRMCLQHASISVYHSKCSTASCMDTQISALYHLCCRYYGDSHPTSDVSLGNLAFLSSRQALRDAVSFKKYIVGQFKMTDHNRWISFGGSYSGALSGWLRMLYPDTVAGAVATSGPVQVGPSGWLLSLTSPCAG